MLLAPELSLAFVLCALPAHVEPPEPRGPFLVTGLVADTGGTVPDVFIGLVRKADVDALPHAWDRVPIHTQTVTNSVGAYSLSTAGMADGELFWVFTGSLEHFNQYSNAGGAPVQGLPSLPTRTDLYALAPSPLTNSANHVGVDFVLSGPSSMLDVPVPVGTSGVTLLTDVHLATDGSYATEGAAGNPVVLVRSMYDKSGTDPTNPGGGAILGTYRGWTSVGYTVVIQNTRGRNGSSGANDVFRTDGWGGSDAQDGVDTIDWIASQSWCDGRVGIVGPSALAITGYLAAGASPDALRAAHVWAGTSDVYSLYFDGGIYREEAMEGWLGGVLGGGIARDNYLNTPGKIVDNPHRSPFWDPVDVATQVGSVQVPMLHVVGWHDLFKDAGIEAFQLLQKYGGTASGPRAGAFGNQRLLIGPWSHVDWFNATQGDVEYEDNAGPGSGGGAVHPEHTDTLAFKSELRFFDHWLRLDPRGWSSGYELEDPVRYYVMGNTDPGGAGNEWRETSGWPPKDAGLREHRFYFLGDTGRLIPGDPGGAAFPRVRIRRAFTTYHYDPTNPVPTIGGPILYATSLEPAGPRDQSPVEGRADVKAFSTALLGSALEVSGEVRVHLSFSSNAPDTDLVVKLTDVYPDGRSILVAEGALQARYRNGLEGPGDLMSGNLKDVYRADVSLGNVSQVFDAGHRIRVSVTSSNYPRLKPNPNTGATFFTADVTGANSQVARVRLQANPWLPAFASWISFPAASYP